ncbi:MAG: flagellar motor switch protein FliG [Candidatus Latescibacterota bacterium]|nr:flagellar motor switch protein FliG [Candidatus Latescibacterota bacterium]
MQYLEQKKQSLDNQDLLSLREKAAILMVSLGEETAGEIMKYLADVEIEELTHIITELKNLPNEIQGVVLSEFEQHLLAGEWVNQGGTDFARATLERALGARRAHEIMERTSQNQNSGFRLLKNVDPEQIAPFIASEHPQTLALILSQLDPDQAAGILSQLPQSTQVEVAYRIATLENITPAILKQVEENLESKLHDILGSQSDIGGPKVVANMLNLTGSSIERSVLQQLDSHDPEIAENVRNMMFLFEDIQLLTDRDVQCLLAEIDQKDIVIALKTASEELKYKILENMSERVRALVEEELSYMGPIRLRDVEEVQLRIVQKVRQLEQQGQVVIRRTKLDEAYV